MNDRDIWLNLSEKAATMKEGVKFAGMMFDKEIWFVKDEAVSGFLRGPSAHPQQASQAQQQFRAELRDRFAMAALTGLLANSVNDEIILGREYAETAYFHADRMLKARDGVEEME